MHFALWVQLRSSRSETFIHLVCCDSLSQVENLKFELDILDNDDDESKIAFDIHPHVGNENSIITAHTLVLMSHVCPTTTQ